MSCSSVGETIIKALLKSQDKCFIKSSILTASGTDRVNVTTSEQSSQILFSSRVSIIASKLTIYNSRLSNRAICLTVSVLPVPGAP